MDEMHPEEKGDEKSKAAQRRDRRRERGTFQGPRSSHKNGQNTRRYMTFLRVALAQYKALDDDYYGSYMGMWEMPTEDATVFSSEHRFILIDSRQQQVQEEVQRELRAEKIGRNLQRRS